MLIALLSLTLFFSLLRTHDCTHAPAHVHAHTQPTHARTQPHAHSPIYAHSCTQPTHTQTHPRAHTQRRWRGRRRKVWTPSWSTKAKPCTTCASASPRSAREETRPSSKTRKSGAPTSTTLPPSSGRPTLVEQLLAMNRHSDKQISVNENLRHLETLFPLPSFLSPSFPPILPPLQSLCSPSPTLPPLLSLPQILPGASVRI